MIQPYLIYFFKFYFQAVEIDDDAVPTTSNNKTTTHKEKVIHIDNESFYEGRVFGELKSRATVHLEDGMLTAKIETPEDIYHIEPSWRHLTNDKNKSPDQMIVYKESDVIHPEKTGMGSLFRNKRFMLDEMTQMKCFKICHIFGI